MNPTHPLNLEPKPTGFHDGGIVPGGDPGVSYAQFAEDFFANTEAARAKRIAQADNLRVMAAGMSKDAQRLHIAQAPVPAELIEAMDTPELREVVRQSMASPAQRTRLQAQLDAEAAARVAAHREQEAMLQAEHAHRRFDLDHLLQEIGGFCLAVLLFLGLGFYFAACFAWYGACKAASATTGFFTRCDAWLETWMETQYAHETGARIDLASKILIILFLAAVLSMLLWGAIDGAFAQAVR